MRLLTENICMPTKTSLPGQSHVWSECGQVPGTEYIASRCALVVGQKVRDVIGTVQQPARSDPFPKLQNLGPDERVEAIQCLGSKFKVKRMGEFKVGANELGSVAWTCVGPV